MYTVSSLRLQLLNIRNHGRQRQMFVHIFQLFGPVDEIALRKLKQHRQLLKIDDLEAIIQLGDKQERAVSNPKQFSLNIYPSSKLLYK